MECGARGVGGQWRAFMRRCGLRFVAPLSLLVAASFAPLATRADGTPASPSSSASIKPPIEDARDHWKRGLELADEHDYEGALIEFRKAYQLAPTYRIEYNIAVVCKEQHDYVCALKSFEAYLAGGQGEIDAARRLEVEQDLDKCRLRVAHLAITTNVSGATIAIDDAYVGVTPLKGPIVVRIGRRKITATREGQPSVTRFVDVAGNETLDVALDLPSAPPARSSSSPPPYLDDATSPSRFTTLSWLGLGGGAVLAGTATVFGILALRSSKDLSETRYVGTTPSAGAKSQQTTTTRLSIASDILFGAAAVTLGVTLVLTLTRRPTDTATHHAMALRVGPGSIALQGSF